MHLKLTVLGEPSRSAQLTMSINQYKERIMLGKDN